MCQQILHRHKGRKFWAFLLLITSAEGRKKKNIIWKLMWVLSIRIFGASVQSFNYIVNLPPSSLVYLCLDCNWKVKMKIATVCTMGSKSLWSSIQSYISQVLWVPTIYCGTHNWTIDCVCSKILNNGLNDGLLFSLTKFFGWNKHFKSTWKFIIKI